MGCQRAGVHLTFTSDDASVVLWVHGPEISSCFVGCKVSAEDVDVGSNGWSVVMVRGGLGSEGKRW